MSSTAIARRDIYSFTLLWRIVLRTSSKGGQANGVGQAPRVYQPAACSQLVIYNNQDVSK